MFSGAIMAFRVLVLELEKKGVVVQIEVFNIESSSVWQFILLLDV